MTSPRADQPPPGWYAEPRSPTGLRYWDGQDWTEHTASTQSPPAAQPWQWTGPQPRDNTLVIVGWVTAFLFPPVALIVGLGLLGKGEQHHGVAILVLSVAVLAMVIVAATASGVIAA